MAASRVDRLGRSVELRMESTAALVFREFGKDSGSIVLRSRSPVFIELVQMMAIRSFVGSSRDDRNRAVSQLATSVAGDAYGLEIISESSTGGKGVRTNYQ